MISDESGRYLAAVLPDFRLWRYDRRWRGVVEVPPAADAEIVHVGEGAHHFAVVARRGDDVLEVTVRPAADPRLVLATGIYDGAWTFTGDAEAWRSVPEYVLVPVAATSSDAPASKGLLRIADGAVIDPLDGFSSPLRLVHVPDSRLLVICSPGAFTVYDPVACTAARHYELAGENPSPLARFRTGDEMWISDFDTMLKLDGRKFDVIDAAGSDVQGPIEVPEGQGLVAGWNFVAGNELCAVARPEVGDVLVLDAMSMLPVARTTFGARRPLDALLIGRNVIVGVDAEGRALRGRLGRVKIRFETDSETAPDAPSAG